MYGILEKIDLPRAVIIVDKPVKSYFAGKDRRYEQYKLITSIPKIVKDFKFIIIPLTEEELEQMVTKATIVDFRHFIIKRYNII